MIFRSGSWSARLVPSLVCVLAATPLACGGNEAGDGAGGGGNDAGTSGSTSSAGAAPVGGGAVDSGGTGGLTGGAGANGGAGSGAAGAGSGGVGLGGAAGGTAGAGGVPAGMVPMFVASGYGARTITSCDDGKTWIADHVYNPTIGECGSPTPCNRSHQDLTEKGLAYGNGIFMQIVGWGYQSSVNISRNGVDWHLVKIPTSLLRKDGNIAFLDQPTPRFVAVSGYGGYCAESPDGETWTACPGKPTYSAQESLREIGGGGPAIGGGGDEPMVFTFDGTKTWSRHADCSFSSEFGNLGQEGGIMWGRDTLVVVNTGGSWCRTGDLGKTWQTGKLSAGAAGKASFTGGKFWAPNGEYAHSSEDGMTWTRTDFEPSTVKIHEMARGDSGTFVGVERLGATGTVSNEPTRFYRSEDGGVNWTMSTAAAGTMFRRVVFGYGLPSAQCPLRP